MRLAYADPPYPGYAHLYPEKTEVDHAELLARLGEYDGWALSTCSPALRHVLALCPGDVHVGAWVKTNPMPFNPDGLGSVRAWEPVIYSPARQKRLDPDRVRDTFHAGTVTGNRFPHLTGAKPEGFAEWVFALMGAETGDDLDDLFPGTGRIGVAWERWRVQPSLFSAARGGHRSGEAPMRKAQMPTLESCLSEPRQVTG